MPVRLRKTSKIRRLGLLGQPRPTTIKQVRLVAPSIRFNRKINPSATLVSASTIKRVALNLQPSSSQSNNSPSGMRQIFSRQSQCSTLVSFKPNRMVSNNSRCLYSLSSDRRNSLEFNNHRRSLISRPQSRTSVLPNNRLLLCQHRVTKVRLQCLVNSPVS